MKRSWVDDSTASLMGDRLHGLKLVLANTVAFEDLAATDETRLNGGKSGYLASSSKAASWVERILDERMLWPHGGVVILGEPGAEEPDWVAEAPQLCRVEQLSYEEAIVAAARASVIIVGPGSHLREAAWEVALATGCRILSGK